MARKHSTTRSDYAEQLIVHSAPISPRHLVNFKGSNRAEYVAETVVFEAEKRGARWYLNGNSYYL